MPISSLSPQRHRRRTTIQRPLLTLLALLAALIPGIALACGLPLNARIVSEQALIVFDGVRQAITTTVGLEPAAAEVAIIFPVPTPPQVDQPAGGEQLFAYLDMATRPVVRRETRLRWGFDPGDTAGSTPPRGVELLGRETLGGYDVARLSADDPQALDRWLADNGFLMPVDASPILADYVARGWSFVAVRLAPDTPAGSLAPLRMSFSSPAMIYPMRLGALSDRPVVIELYTLADYRTTLSGLTTEFAGPLATLDPAPEPAVAALLSGGSFLTRLHSSELAPEQIVDDFILERVADNQPYRRVVTLYNDVWIFSAYGPVIIALICLLLLSIGLIIGAIVLRRHMLSIGARGG